MNDEINESLTSWSCLIEPCCLAVAPNDTLLLKDVRKLGSTLSHLERSARRKKDLCVRFCRITTSSVIFTNLLVRLFVLATDHSRTKKVEGLPRAKKK